MLFRDMRVSVSPAPVPEATVAFSGVLVRGLISAMNLKSSPSSAIAHRTRGIGNIAPSRLPGGETRIYSIHTYTQENAVRHTVTETRAHIRKKQQSTRSRYQDNIRTSSAVQSHKPSPISFILYPRIWASLSQSGLEQ